MFVSDDDDVPLSTIRELLKSHGALPTSVDICDATDVPIEQVSVSTRHHLSQRSTGSGSGKVAVTMKQRSTGLGSLDEHLTPVNSKDPITPESKRVFRKRKITQKPLSGSSDEYDNSDKDPDYKDDDKDFSDTCISDNNDIELSTLKPDSTVRKTDKKRPAYNCIASARHAVKEMIRNKGWKRKATNIRNKVKVKRVRKTTAPATEESPHKSSENDPNVDKAIQISKNEQTVFNILKRYHTDRLNNILTSNNLSPIPIESNGNCFMNAVACQLSDEIVTGNEIRKKLCDHIKEHKEEYVKFLSTATGGNVVEDVQQRFNREMVFLEKDGHWSNALSDCLPLAVANTYHREVRIYTSKVGMPVISVHPSMTEEEYPCFLLAYFNIPGHEHYDACTTTQRNPPNNSITTTPEKSQPKVQVTNSPHVITPRKQAAFQTPPKGSTSRKRIANQKQWKKNVRKRLRLGGKEYTSSEGKIKPARQMKSGCGKCRFKCSTNISEEERQTIFSSYWDLSNYERQRDFLCHSVRENETKPGEKANKRDVARTYTLRVKGRNIRVCKTFLLDTLSIGRKTVDVALKKCCNGVYSGTDQRGKHVPANKTTNKAVDLVKEHINSFPLVESHYIRKTSKRKYLAPGLSIQKMYDLYIEYCKAKDDIPVKSKVYRRIFCTEFNISFHTPKKDQCLECELYKQKESTGKVGDDEKKKHEAHMQRKVRAREEKLSAKLTAMKDPSVHAVTFDLESVLHTPCSLVSQVYYKRKLSSYNLSVYSLRLQNRHVLFMG